jgi:hypothetical protein
MTRVHRVRNKVIREQSGIQAIGDWMNKRKEERSSHVSRMAEDEIALVVRDNSPKC